MNKKDYYTQYWIDLKADPVKLAAHYDKQREQRAKRKQRGETDPEIKARKRTKEWRELNQEKYLYHTIQNSSRRRGLEFNLTLEDINIPEFCPYLGVRLTNIQGNGQQDFNPSVDRIDNSKGYIKGNVEVISRLANRMKLKATKEQLIIFAKNILSRYD